MIQEEKIMNKILPNGIWPTMITPFHEDGSIDFDSLKNLVDWYINKGVNGLFAVCQSSEMFYLSSEEKISLANATVSAAAGRVPVISSGHTADKIEDQIEELMAMSETGIEALVLVSNRLANENEDDQVFKKNLDRIVSSIDPSMPLGFYECPYPYKRLLSEDVLRYTLSTGRFSFLKDTCCQSDMIEKRMKILEGSDFKLFNANAATLSLSLKAGAHGYSGIMANFHPELYQNLFRIQTEQTGRGDSLQNILGPFSAIEDNSYPLSAKVYLKSLGVLESAWTRKLNTSVIDENHRLIMEQMSASTATLIAGGNSGK